MMKFETLARSILFLLIIAAAAVPLAGSFLSLQPGPVPVLDLHARMAENGGWSLDTIQLQAGQPVRLRLTSDDVIHSFAIGRSDQPALEVRPGEVVETTLQFDRPGKYTYYCTRWCGANHWRMRGTIEVTGPGTPVPPDPQPLFLKLGLDLDMPELAAVTPASPPAAEQGNRWANVLPAYALSRETYLSNSPARLWQRLRAEPALALLNDSDLWDVIAWLWQRQAPPEKLTAGQKLYATNCAACHGETGQGDGVMVRGLPLWDPTAAHATEAGHTELAEKLYRPPDFTDPKTILGASPAFLEGKIIRGGMGTGMPYWGPVLTSEQTDALIAYLYTFAEKR